MTAPILVPISPGELFDKITILSIKSHRITDAAKLHNVRTELDALEAVRSGHVPMSPELERVVSEMKRVNEALWDVEDELRDCERRKDFGPKFVELARAVYVHNDRRAAFKKQINELLGSPLVEEKSYAAY